MSERYLTFCEHFRHNDLPWNLRKFLRNEINDFELNTDLTVVEPWSKSKYSHTDLPRLRAGMMGAQVKFIYDHCDFGENSSAVFPRPLWGMGFSV